MPVITVYTIGHSTRSADDFLAILRAFAIELVVDIRTVPRSRRNPQFDQAELRRSLAQARIEYLHLPELGGLRRSRKDSINTGWQNASFRGYADYMQTVEFAGAIDDLIAMATGRRTVIMCAEAVPWRCHRSLVADALVVRNIAVENILGETNSKPHKLTPWARVEGLAITYPDATPRIYSNKNARQRNRPLASPVLRMDQLMPDQEEHEKPQNMVEESQELEREAAQSLAQAVDSHATLQGFYAVNDVKPDPKLDQEATQDRESNEGDREKGRPVP